MRNLDLTKPLLPAIRLARCHRGSSSSLALAINSVYHIPFHSGSRLVNEALGGWQLSQAYQFQTGTPFSVATSQDIAGVGAGFQSQLLQITPGASLRGNGKFSVGADSNSWFATKNGDGTSVFTSRM